MTKMEFVEKWSDQLSRCACNCCDSSDNVKHAATLLLVTMTDHMSTDMISVVDELMVARGKAT